MMKTNIFYTLPVSSGLSVPCSNDDAASTSMPDGGGNGIVKVSTTKHAGRGMIIENEFVITDIQACISEGGNMSGICNGIISSEGSLYIQTERYSGTLHVLANACGQTDLDGLMNQYITEVCGITGKFC